ncbi:WhiB family transcriptional regulator [Streptomyces sp. NPDC047981]|uniref:WhiB family transcriptional regulator n=1 Tax=Streptomyces sp. NPDC047981 TaxID=3154610 RepID=UPI00344692D8
MNPRSDWMQDSLCSAAPDLFFPVGTGARTNRQAAAAKALCRRCPVIEPCRAWALSTGPLHGIWGGMTRADRRQLRLEQEQQESEPRAA